MRMIDFSDWHTVLSTLASLALITIIGMGLRLLLMMTVQERRQRQNRQINERLKVLIAAYKTLGGSFTGELTVDPLHLRDLRRMAPRDGETAEDAGETSAGSDRDRRIRDAVEGALSDILLLGTEDQVRLAAAALDELVGGRRAWHLRIENARACCCGSRHRLNRTVVLAFDDKISLEQLAAFDSGASGLSQHRVEMGLSFGSKAEITVLDDVEETVRASHLAE